LLQAVKSISASGSAQFSPFQALYGVMNEYSQIVCFKFVKGKGADEVIPILQGIKRRYELQVLGFECSHADWTAFGKNWPLPEVVYSDNCCADRPAITQVFPRALVIATFALLHAAHFSFAHLPSGEAGPLPCTAAPLERHDGQGLRGGNVHQSRQRTLGISRILRA
jgi:hypothetical protein